MFSEHVFNFTTIIEIFLNETIHTLDVLSFDSFDSDVTVILLVVTLEDVAVLATSYFTLEHIVIDYLWHCYI